MNLFFRNHDNSFDQFPHLTHILKSAIIKRLLSSWELSARMHTTSAFPDEIKSLVISSSSELAVRLYDPGRALNTVDLPELGCPRSAIVVGLSFA